MWSTLLMLSRLVQTITFQTGLLALSTTASGSQQYTGPASVQIAQGNWFGMAVVQKVTSLKITRDD